MSEVCMCKNSEWWIAASARLERCCKEKLLFWISGHWNIFLKSQVKGRLTTIKIRKKLIK